MRPREAMRRRIEILEERSTQTVDQTDDLRRIVAAIRACRPNEPTPAALDRARAALDELPPKWRELFGSFVFHEKQASARASQARRRAIEAGRRSGKTVDRKAEIVERALDPDWVGYSMGLTTRYIVVGLPTQGQTNDRYLDDLRRLIPPRFVRHQRKKDPPTIETVTGARITLAGMDVPARAEGDPIDDLFLDEFADMRHGSAVIDQHLRASLSTRGRPPGTVTVYGTPDMRCGAHFVELCDRWQALAQAGDPGFAHFRWPSKGIVTDEEIEEARDELDYATFAVEYEAKRVSTGNRAYHEFDRETHCSRALLLFQRRPVILTLDWNWSPGTACMAQEQMREDYPPGSLPANVGQAFTAVLGEVFMRQTNTPQVLRSVLAWLESNRHTGPVRVYGDPAGGAQGAAKVAGSEIDLVRSVLGPVLGERLSLHFARAAPRIVARLSAVNSRLRNAKGEIRMLFEPDSAPETVKDFEQVHTKEGAHNLEIEKPKSGKGAERTHLSDGLGYFVAAEYPIVERGGIESTDA